MSDNTKVGPKMAPTPPKGVVLSKSPKDLSAIKKLPGTSPLKLIPKGSGLPAPKPSAGTKNILAKPGANEVKAATLSKVPPSGKPELGKKVTLPTPKTELDSKSQLPLKKATSELPSKVGIIKTESLPSKTSAQAETGKSSGLPEKSPPTEVKKVQVIKGKTPVASQPVSEVTPKANTSTPVKVPATLVKNNALPPTKVKAQEKDLNNTLNKVGAPDTAKPKPQLGSVPQVSNTQNISSGTQLVKKDVSNKCEQSRGISLTENMKGNLDLLGPSYPTNFQGLDPAMWQMVTTIAAICSAACQNNIGRKGRHCCRKHHSRKHKKDTEVKEGNSNSSNKDSNEMNEIQEAEITKESKNDKTKRTNQKKDTQNENAVSGTKWHGIEKKIANIRGLRDLDEVDPDNDDEVITSDDFNQGINQPRYTEFNEFPSELSAMNGNAKTRRYLAKQGVCSGPKFAKTPFVGGLSAARRRPYSSLTEMAAYFSNIEPQDQNDVIVMLLACRKLEKQIEEQQVVMQLLEHDLKEAQSLLRFPPEWRSLSNSEVLGNPPLPAGQIPSTNDPPYVSNHPGIEPPWVNKRPKDSLPSRAPTKL
ncbi:putative low complexity protein [Cryptosporidium felis]|nr:putative low complexity protein [Cryptosporidium felis]